jgi:hypothetical protein
MKMFRSFKTNEKNICWADNFHIINDTSSFNRPIGKDFISIGSYIKKELKDKKSETYQYRS